MKLQILSTLILFALTGLAHAQDTPSDWEVTFYVQQENGIVTLYSDGEMLALDAPDQLKDIPHPQIFLSSDNHWLAFENYPDSAAVYIANLNTGSCCISFDQAIELPDGTQPNIWEWIGFSPDNQQGALLYSIYEENCFEVCFPKKGIVLIDLNTQELTPASQIKVSMEQFPAGWSQHGITLANGFICIEGDICTDPLRLSSQSVRDVETGQRVSSMPIVMRTQLFWSDFGDHLPLTGEYISAYFFNPEPPNDQIYIPEIVYYAPEMDAVDWKESPAPIYVAESLQNFPPDPAYFSSARWVMDGNAVFISISDGTISAAYGTPDDTKYALLLMRDGTQQIIELSGEQDFLAGTTDGWLMVDRFPQGDEAAYNEINIYRYSYANGMVSVVASARFKYSSVQPILIRSTPLGASVREPFVTVPQPEYQEIG